MIDRHYAVSDDLSVTKQTGGRPVVVVAVVLTDVILTAKQTESCYFPTRHDTTDCCTRGSARRRSRCAGPFSGPPVSGVCTFRCLVSPPKYTSLFGLTTSAGSRGVSVCCCAPHYSWNFLLLQKGHNKVSASGCETTRPGKPPQLPPATSVMQVFAINYGTEVKSKPSRTSLGILRNCELLIVG
uniref:Uncharacterized protein n=1 Tax=Anopheles arabiensis TaxID=7173 RepID=A0A182IH93_ANOAR